MTEKSFDKFIQSAGEKIEKLSKVVVNKTNDLIESGKDKIAISKEEKSIEEKTLEIGKIIVALLDAGEATQNSKISEYYQSIVESRKNIENIKNN